MRGPDHAIGLTGMPRTLLLMRHAKSSWDDPAVSDFDRQLNNRGRKAAPRIGNHIREMGLNPDLILCSTAKRARETCQLVEEALGGDIDVKLLKSLYLARRHGVQGEKIS